MDWITDRLPTAADADGYGNVRTPKHPADLPDKSRDGSHVHQHYSLIVPGQPWWSRWAVQTDPAPAEPPAPTPVVERKIVQIVYSPESEYQYASVVALCDDGTAWGTSWQPDETIWDPWEQLPPIPPPGPPS